MQQKTSTFFALSLSYPGCSHVGSLFTSGDPKGLARDVTDTSATQAQFKTSHAQNDTHKTAVLMVLFPCLKKQQLCFVLLLCPLQEIQITLTGTAAARIALPQPISVCSIFVCPNNGVTAKIV